MADSFTLSDLRSDQAGGSFTLDDLQAEQKPKRNGFLQGVGNLAAGAFRGAGSIGATLMAPIDMASDALAGKGFSLQSNRERRDSMDSALQSLGAEPDSWMYKGGKLTGEIAGTAGAGGLLGNGLARLAPNAVASVPRAAQLVEAIKSGGFTLGGQAATTLGGRAVDIGIRSAGGAVSGAASAGMVNPEDAGFGALVGGLLPAGVQAVGTAAGTVGRGIRNLRQPQEVNLANRLADLSGMKTDDLLSVLSQQGPNTIPGYRQTVPQILQNPEISQLQRTLKTAGTNAIGDAERVQQSQMRAALERVAPIDLSVQDAAARAGSAIQSYAVPARAAAGKRVSSAFDAVDPFGESAVHLPIDEMQAAAAKYLGPGTFGAGGKADSALQAARQAGMQELPAIKATAQSMAGQGQTLEQAVRSAGGLRGNSGELRDLGIRQSGTTGLINNKSGKSADLLAEEMQRRGFLPDADPATLYDALRNGAGRKIYSSDFAEASYAGRLEQSMGELPGAETISKAVPFGTLQNLRSSIGEAANQSKLAGNNKDAAALKQMVQEMDLKLKRVAGGDLVAGEFFDPLMVSNYQSARKLHAEKIAQFETGPQIGMFRQGGDGQLSMQGAEIPGKFYSGRRSQVDDLQSFNRLIGDNRGLLGDLKSYAVTEGASTANAIGDLTSKYSKWLQSRSGANRELFTSQENATLGEVGKAVDRGLKAESLGRVSGSDTAQKLAALNSLGLLDNKMVDVLATRIPIIGAFTAPMMNGLRDTAAKTRNNALANLLANPADLAAALKSGTPQSNALLEYMNRMGAVGSNVAPVLSAQ